MIALAETVADAAVGRIAALAEDGAVLVEMADGRRLACVRVHASDAPLTLAPGDEVLVLPRPAGPALLLGRIGASAADGPDELVLEARSRLTLRVGDGSITLGGDGRILLKGRDLVSHAARTNRIRGGSVEIN